MARTRLCVGEDCRHERGRGQVRGTTTDGRLCRACRNGLATDLRHVPRLHEECGRLLNGRRGEPQPRRPRQPQSNVPLNTAAFEVRSTMADLLRSWTSLVVEERAVGAPPNAVADLAGFLLRHLDWLASHGAAGDFSTEISEITRRARRLVDPEPLRRFPVGDCVEPDCSGFLTAFVRTDTSGEAADIRCDAETTHRWSGHHWLRLSQRMRRTGSGATSAATAEPAWLSAADIARLWQVPSGSIYRLASEHSWRRRARGRRTYYHERDVETTLRARESRSA